MIDYFCAFFLLQADCNRSEYVVSRTEYEQSVLSETSASSVLAQLAGLPGAFCHEAQLSPSKF